MRWTFNVSLIHHSCEKLLCILTYQLGCIGVEESSWAFKNTFSITEEELAAPNVDLVFEGVDTLAVITLVS
jgi:hypothetical protein